MDPALIYAHYSIKFCLLLCSHVCSCVLIAEVEKHDKEGRVITAEFDKFYFVTACTLYYTSRIFINSQVYHLSIQNNFFGDLQDIIWNVKNV